MIPEDHPCRCSCCDGEGKCSNHLNEECDCCDGSGECTATTDCGAEIDLQCEECNGTGRVNESSSCKEMCELCDGKGVVHNFNRAAFAQVSLNGRRLKVEHCSGCRMIRLITESGRILEPLWVERDAV